MVRSRSQGSCALPLTERTDPEIKARERGAVRGEKSRRHDFAVPDSSSSEARLNFSPLGFVNPRIPPYSSHKVIAVLGQKAVPWNGLWVEQQPPPPAAPTRPPRLEEVPQRPP